MKQRFIILGIVLVVLYFTNKNTAQPAAEKGKKIAPHVIITPKIFKADDVSESSGTDATTQRREPANNASSAPSFVDDALPSPASVDTSPQAGLSYFPDVAGLNTEIVDLQIQVSDLASENERLKAQLAAYQRPVQAAQPLVYRTYSYCVGPNCQPQQPVRYQQPIRYQAPANYTYQRRGIFGWRR